MNGLYNQCAFSSEFGQILQISCIPVIFKEIILWLLIFSGVAALFFIIFGGIKFITSGGDEKQVEGAKKTLTYAIIGLVIILLSFTVVRFISDVTGVSCIRGFGFGCAVERPHGRPT